MNNFVLSEDQEEARDVIASALRSGEPDLVLAGPAGSGKTSLTRALIQAIEDQGRHVVLMAPTGKAAVRLAQVVGRPTKTIHSLLFGLVLEGDDGEVSFHRPRAVAQVGSVVVCDEASMVGLRIHEKMRSNLHPEVQILYVGDREQLEPVMDVWGPNFSHPTAALTRVHRQAEASPIIRLATAIRERRSWPEQAPGYASHSADLEAAARWLTQARRAGASATLITYTNSTRQRLNALCRKMRFGAPAPVEVGDVLVCLKNNPRLGLMNGEVAVVTTVEPESEGVVKVRLDADGKKRSGRIQIGEMGSKGKLEDDGEGGARRRRDREAEFDEETSRGVSGGDPASEDGNEFLQCDYGDCLTIHKSQGSEWSSVGIVIDRAFGAAAYYNSASHRRMLYTAVTRAKRQLVIFYV